MASPLDDLDREDKIIKLVWWAGSTAELHDCEAKERNTTGPEATALVLSYWCVSEDPGIVDDALRFAERLADLDRPIGPDSSPIVAVDVLTEVRRRLAVLDG